MEFRKTEKFAQIYIWISGRARIWNQRSLFHHAMLCSHLSCRIIFLSNTDYSMYSVYRGFLLLSYTNNALSNEFSKMRWFPHTSYPIYQQFRFQALSLHDQCLIKSSRSPRIFWMVYCHVFIPWYPVLSILCFYLLNYIEWASIMYPKPLVSWDKIIYEPWPPPSK